MSQTVPFYRELFREYPDIVTVAQAAVMLRVGKSSIYRLIESGSLESIPIRGAHRITKNSVVRFLVKSEKERSSDL